MRSVRTTLVAGALLLVLAGAARAQFGRPPVFRPPVFHPPVMPHVPVHVPIHIPPAPNVPLHRGPFPTVRADFRLPGPGPLARYAATAAGLAGSPLGPVLVAAAASPDAVPAWSPGEPVARDPYPERLATQTATAVGLAGSPLALGPVFVAAASLPEAAPLRPDNLGNLEVVPERAGPRVNAPGRPGADSTPGAAFWVFLLAIGGIIAAVAVAASRGARGPAVVGRVRIVALPPGEAPEEIRRAWVGLELPVVEDASVGPQGVVGVRSHRSAGRCAGYAVDGAEAVRILAAEAPAAAAWWRRNAPHVLATGYQLVFPAEVCRRVG